MSGVGDSEPERFREDAAHATDSRETRLRRLKIRCWRRGSKEMDLLLGGFIDASAAQLTDADLTVFEALIREDDDVLYGWIAGRAPAPAELQPMVEKIARDSRPR